MDPPITTNWTAQHGNSIFQTELYTYCTKLTKTETKQNKTFFFGGGVIYVREKVSSIFTSLFLLFLLLPWETRSVQALFFSGAKGSNIIH